MSGSITQMLQDAKSGEQNAQNQLFHRVFEEVVTNARKRLIRNGAKRRTVDEEDVASEVLNTLFAAIEAGRYPRLDDRSDLWKILFDLVEKRAKNQRRSEKAIKRGEGKVRGDSVINEVDQNFANQCPDPRTERAGDQEVQDLVDLLLHMFATESDEYLEIVKYKLAGYRNKEIADMMDRSVATVERRVRQIRDRCKAHSLEWGNYG